MTAEASSLSFPRKQTLIAYLKQQSPDTDTKIIEAVASLFAGTRNFSFWVSSTVTMCVSGFVPKLQLSATTANNITSSLTQALITYGSVRYRT